MPQRTGTAGGSTGASRLSHKNHVPKTTRVKNFDRHIWQVFVEMAEDIRHTPQYRYIHKPRQQKIERIFTEALDKHDMRYTQYRGLAQVMKRMKLKYAWRGPRVIV